MSFSDTIAVISLAVGSLALTAALVIAFTQAKQVRTQFELANSLASLEVREKLGTISSRAERLEAARDQPAEALAISPDLPAKERDRRLELRAQIMYLLYDCLAVHEVYDHAREDVKIAFRDVIMRHYDLWAAVPLIEHDAFGLDPGMSLRDFFRKKLAKLELGGSEQDPLAALNALIRDQAARATALANLELREKFGTISSRAERLEAIRGVPAGHLVIEAGMETEERDRRLEWRAQIMYLVYDLLAVYEVYDQAAPTVQQEFRELIASYNDVWESVPLINAERFALAPQDSLRTFLETKLVKLVEPRPDP
jgi:hypothetical protein